MADVLIVAETDAGRLRSDFWELVTVGRQLAAGTGGKLLVAVLGDGLEAAVAEVRRSDAHRVYRVEDPRLSEPWPDAHLAACAGLVRHLSPGAVVLPRSLLGMEVAARLAFRLGTGVAQDVMTVAVEGDTLVATRPVFGGAVVARVSLAARPWLVVPRPRAFPPAEPLSAAGTASGDGAAVVPVVPELPAEALKTRCGDRVRQQSEQNLDKARVIVAGGRGMGSAESFGVLREVAEILGGAVAASRPPCDAGWVPPALQIGLTGRTVAPDLYLAVGISGSSQHMAGCANARVLVAVNSDPQAPVFRMATYGAVGNWQEVLPALRDTLAAVVGSGAGGVGR